MRCLLQSLNIFMILSCLISSALAAVPRHQGGHFFISGEGAFVKQSSDGTAYSVLDFSGDEAVAPMGTLIRIDPSYKVSGGGQLAYFFNNKSDVRFDFFIHDHYIGPQTHQDVSEAHFDAPLAPAQWGVVAAESIASEFTFRTNVFNVSIGYTPVRNRLFRIHPYVGVNVSNIKLEQRVAYNSYVVIEDEPEANAFIDENSSVTGVGPLFGVGIAYEMFKPISFVGDISVAMLMGQVRSNYRASTTDFMDLDPVDIRSKTNLSSFEMVNVKVGMEYQARWLNAGVLEVTAGYRATKYIGVAATHGLPDDTNVSYAANQFENSSFYGPFLSIGLHVM